MAANRSMFVYAAAISIFSALILNSNFPPGWRRGSSTDYADLMVTNATIFTADASLPFAEAMAVKDGRIVRIGNFSSVQDLVGSKTYNMNLERMVVVPGFIDSHVHFLNGGLQMAHAQLRNVRSHFEFVEKVKEAAEGKCKGCWILGGGWNNDFWGGDLPTAAWINDLTPNHPVWLFRMDGHMGLANFLALKLAGISNETKDPIGGSIQRTSTGEPTGLLVDTAMELIVTLIPELSISERRDALLRASKYALSKGVTTVSDFGRFFPGTSVDHVWQDFSDVYQWADSMDKMLIRVSLFFPIQTWSHLVELVRKNGRALSDKIYLGGVKAFADGSLGSNSALFYESYTDDSNNYGLQVTDYNWLLNVTSASDKHGLQVAIHAIGDKANDLILDLYKTVASINGIRQRRFRVEHAQHLAAGTPARFGQQEVIASVQPQHLLDDAYTAEKKIGAYRANTGSYLFRSLITNMTELAFGSDWPVSDIDPLGAIKTAMTRAQPGSEAAWIPSERISLNEALKASTISAARACFIDEDVGSLTVGKFADFVVLSVNSWEEFSKNPSPSIFATFVDGVQAYP